MLTRIKNKISREFNSFLNRRNSGIVSYSQCGEDLIVRHIFNLRGMEKPSYLDIGAHHPFALSNTAIFYKNGCRGVNVEANPELLKQFERHRKRDVNLNLGIGNKIGTLRFYVMEDSTLSTFSAEEYRSLVYQKKKLKREIEVEVIGINQLIEKYCSGFVPDFLSLDVEGLDLEILQTLNFDRYSPKVICIEAAEYSPIGAGKKRHDIINFLIMHDYIEYANTNLNAIMVKREFWLI
jgi:FkbM family methyltransferase